MTDLTDFLLARIDEDEAVAREVQDELRALIASGVYRAGHEPAVDGTSVVHGDGNMDNPAVIVGPARVLAECEAKRRIVEFHRSWPVLVERPVTIEPVVTADPQSLALRASRQIAWITGQEYREKFGSEPPTAPMLLAMAAVYADHPDYREEWKP